MLFNQRRKRFCGTVSVYVHARENKKKNRNFFYDYSVNNQKVNSECFKMSAKKVNLSKAH